VLSLSTTNSSRWSEPSYHLISTLVHKRNLGVSCIGCGKARTCHEPHIVYFVVERIFLLVL
jgi:hypothetical protein